MTWNKLWLFELWTDLSGIKWLNHQTQQLKSYHRNLNTEYLFFFFFNYKTSIMETQLGTFAGAD